MKNKITLTILISVFLSVLILSITVTVASAQLLTPGVTGGDVFNYNYNVSWNSTDPTLPVPDVIAELNQTQSFQIKITSVSATTITAETTTTYHDGTTNTQTGFVDVQSGAIHIPHGNLIIAGNLNANDKIYPSGGDAIINNTSVRTYQTGNRQTNELLVETTSTNHYDKTDVYYDKAKGIAVSSYYESTDTFGSETETFTETITNTNADVWATTNTPIASTTTSAPDTATTTISPGAATTNEPTKAGFVFSTVELLAVIAVIVIVLVVVVAVYGRRRKPKTQQTQTEYLGTF